MIISLIGLPGSGKGTYSEAISEKFNIPRIEPGRMLREEVAKGSAIGKEIKPFMDAGKIPPVHITIKMVSEFFAKHGGNGAVFDGYPRNMEQAEAMENFAKPDIVINLILPDEIIIEKILARRTCPRCNAIYNLVYIDRTVNGINYNMPPLLPKKEGICDICNSKLIQRSDETTDIIKTRLKVQRDALKPLIDYYENKGILKNVNVTYGRDEMLKKIFEIIGRNLRP